MLQIFQTATSQRAALYTKCQLLLQGSVKLKKTVILRWKSHKSKAQSSGVCIKIKKKVIGISHSFILWIRKSRNGKFKITYIYFEFFFTVVLNSIFIFIHTLAQRWTIVLPTIIIALYSIFRLHCILQESKSAISL